MKKLFITGSSGTLGTRLLESLNDQYQITLFQGDITLKSELADQIPPDIDAVLHLASIVPVDVVENNRIKAFDVNVGGTINLINELDRSNLKPYFLLTSTSHVYAPKAGKIVETDELNPHSLYGKSKLIAEDILRNTYKGPFCIARIFSFYDELQEPPFLYPNIIRRLGTEDLNAPFELYGANSERDFLTAREVSEILVRLLEAHAIGELNIGSGQATTIREFVSKISPVKLDIQSKGNFNSIVADTTKLRELL